MRSRLSAISWLIYLCPLALYSFTPTAVAQVASIDAQRPTVLITGSNRGIGYAFASHYAREGWNVIATARNPDAAADLQALASDYEHLLIERLDVTDDLQINTLAETYEGTPIDLLINNAGIAGDLDAQQLGNLDYNTFKSVMTVNAYGPLKMLDAFLEHVAASERKTIVTITSSVASLTPDSGLGVLYFYSSSKTAVNMIMRTAQKSLRSRGIIVALIAPGMVTTDMQAPFRERAASSGRISPPAMQPKESVAGMARVIAALDENYDGMPINYDGTILPW